MSRLTGLLFFCALGIFSSCKLGLNSPSAQHESSIIILERTACYGTCPVYKIQLESNGRAYLTNTRFVEPLGIFQGVASEPKIESIFKTFQTVSWEQYQDKYDENVSDLPTAILTWYHSGYKKVIELRSNYPSEFDVLLKMIDELKAEIEWVAPEK
jgi:hypothetical protein